MRAAVAGDPQQGELAADVLRDAELVAVTLPSLCEFVWVLARGYKREAHEILGPIELIEKILTPSLITTRR